MNVDPETLRELVDLARLTPSGRNAQPLKYILSTDRSLNGEIFSTLLWAAYLKDWAGPDEGERPSAYIVMLIDKEIRQSVSADHGISAQTILLGAVEKGLGGCIVASIHKDQLVKILNISDQFEILLVLAIGKPKEQVIIENIAQSADIKYWRDENNKHHVPKRSLDEIIVQVKILGKRYFNDYSLEGVYKLSNLVSPEAKR